ncbi:MAG TPA: non-canonical purine NTP pyrophosphatase, partial [Candidatus Polarisedimenticolia bacterium]|nr:non-canonical purine NTP pyrophosphatase [Candidatus Polarisedimenticolia bacterium]
TPAGPTRTFRGVCEGRIALEGRGTGGFGYDPLFYYPPFGATFGEIAEERKHAVSHRGRALGLLVSFLVSEEGRKFLPTGGS